MKIINLFSIVSLLFFPTDEKNLGIIKKNSYNYNSSSQVETERFLPNFYTTDHSEYFKINNFKIGRVGMNQVETYTVSYTILRPTFYFLMEFNYSYNDGDMVLGDDDYYAPGPSHVYGDIVRTLSFSVNRDNYESPFESFNIYIKSFTEKYNSEIMYSDQFISFSLVNAYHEINIDSSSCKLPYLFSYSSVSKEGTISYDMITFKNYSSFLSDLIYFRVRLDHFYFSSYGPKSYSDFIFTIYNDNGSFSSALIGSSLLLVPNYSYDNNFYLSYKNARRGGYNLYLNPFTGMMSRNYSANNFIEVNNLYLPLLDYYRYSDLSCGLKIKSFGNCSMTVRWDFSISFYHEMFEYYDGKIQFGKVIDDSGLEEVPIV